MILRVALITAICASVCMLPAQVFTIGPDSVAVSGTHDTLFLEAHTTLVNTQDTAINVAWRREIIAQPAEWINYLCSDFLCFLPENDSGNIYVLPNQEMDVNMTFFPQGVPGIGEVVVTFWDTTDMAGSAVQIKYTCEAMTTSVNELCTSDVVVFPNPASGYLRVAGTDRVEKIEIIPVSGSVVRQSFNTYIPLNGLPAGYYIAQIHMASGQIIVKRVTKL